MHGVRLNQNTHVPTDLQVHKVSDEADGRFDSLNGTMRPVNCRQTTDKF